MSESARTELTAEGASLKELRDFIVMHALTWNFDGRLSDHPFWQRVEAQLSKTPGVKPQ